MLVTTLAARSETSFYFSGPYSYVAGGETELITTNNGVIEFDTVNYTDDHGMHLWIYTASGEYWHFDASAAGGGQLQVGLYDNATRFPFNTDNPGLSFWGCGRGDNTLTGWFDVSSIAYSNGVLVSAAIDWVQYDEGVLSEKITGYVHYNYIPPPSLSVLPARGFAGSGPVGGPFAPSAQNFAITNSGGGTLNWSIINTSAWLNVSQTVGSVTNGDTATVTVAASAGANSLSTGDYESFVVFSNELGSAVSVPFELSVGQLVLNGGFEMGDFTGWTQSGITDYNSVTNALCAYVHFGNCGALLGATPSPGSLAQSVPTVPGQTYALSFWLRNPTGGSLHKSTPNMFQASWNGVPVFAQTNITSDGWNQYQFNVTATSTATPLVFSFEDDPAFLALDDVSVFPSAAGAATAAVAGFSSPSSDCLQMTWKTSAGQNYQLQHATTLAPPNWIDVGSPVTADADTLTFFDCNLPGTPQGFYQLLIVQ